MSEEGRRRRRGTPPAGRAIGWWIAGFEERIYPQRETVEERVRWGTETRVGSGEGPGVVVRFPGESTDHAGRTDEGEAGDPAARVDPGGPDDADAAPDGAEGPGTHVAAGDGHPGGSRTAGAGDPTPGA